MSQSKPLSTGSYGKRAGAIELTSPGNEVTFRAMKPPQISEDVLLVVAASVAAFLGERAHIRQVRLVASDAWAQQGRVSVMASHRWAVHR